MCYLGSKPGAIVKNKDCVVGQCELPKEASSYDYATCIEVQLLGFLILQVPALSS